MARSGPTTRFSQVHFQIILDYMEDGGYNKLSNLGQKGNRGMSKLKAFNEVLKYFKSKLEEDPSLCRKLDVSLLNATCIMRRWDEL
ncbi:hypothetical protein BGX21_007762, partial [Mortierella sp. AD011]